MRRALATLLVVLAVVGVGGYLADSYVRSRAESQAASAIQSALSLDAAPGVTLGGFPFSLAFLTRSVPSARVTAREVPLTVSGHKVNLSDVMVDSDTIRLAGGDVRLARASGTAVLGYGDLAELAGVPVSYAGDGRLKVNYTTSFGGQQLGVGVTAVPELDVDAEVIRLTKLKLEPEGSLSASLGGARLTALAKPIPVKLPKGARLTALTPSEGGVAVAAIATDLTFSLS